MITLPLPGIDAAIVDETGHGSTAGGRGSEACRGRVARAGRQGNRTDCETEGNPFRRQRAIKLSERRRNLADAYPHLRIDNSQLVDVLLEDVDLGGAQSCDAGADDYDSSTVVRHGIRVITLVRTISPRPRPALAVY
jgi:hypothetical protein